MYSISIGRCSFTEMLKLNPDDTEVTESTSNQCSSSAHSSTLDALPLSDVTHLLVAHALTHNKVNYERGVLNNSGGKF